MKQETVPCPECDGEVAVQPAGQMAFAAYVVVGLSNAGVEEKLQRAFDLLETAAAEVPYRRDLAQALRLLEDACGTLEVVLDS